MLFNKSGKIEVHFNDRESSVRHVIFLSTSHGQLLTICYRSAAFSFQKVFVGDGVLLVYLNRIQDYTLSEKPNKLSLQRLETIPKRDVHFAE